MANHCDSHPIGLIHFARTSRGRPVWDLDTLDYLQQNMLSPEASPPNTPEEEPSTHARSKRRLDFADQATQPYDMDDDGCVRD